MHAALTKLVCARRPTPSSCSPSACTRCVSQLKSWNKVGGSIKVNSPSHCRPAAHLASSSCALRARAAASTGRGRVGGRRKPVPQRPARCAASSEPGDEGGLEELGFMDKLERHRPWASRAEQQRQAARQSLAREGLATAAALLAEPAGPGQPRPQALLANFLRSPRWLEVMALVLSTGDAGRPLYWPGLKLGDVVSPVAGVDPPDWVAVRQGPRAFARLLCRKRLAAPSGQPLWSLSLGNMILILKASLERWVALKSGGAPQLRSSPQLRALVPAAKGKRRAPATGQQQVLAPVAKRKGVFAVTGRQAPPSQRRLSTHELQQFVKRTAKWSRASTAGKSAGARSRVTTSRAGTAVGASAVGTSGGTPAGKAEKYAWGATTDKGVDTPAPQQYAPGSGTSSLSGRQGHDKRNVCAPQRQVSAPAESPWFASTRLSQASVAKLQRYGGMRGGKADGRRVPAEGRTAKTRGKAGKNAEGRAGQPGAGGGSSAPAPALYTVVSDGPALGGQQEWGSGEVAPALPQQPEEPAEPYRAPGSPGPGSAASTGVRSGRKRGQEVFSNQGRKAASKKARKAARNAARKEHKGPKRPKIGTWGRSGRRW